MALLLRLLLFCLWPLGAVSASEILLVGASDQPGVRSFVSALEARRPNDRCISRPSTPCPSQGS